MRSRYPRWWWFQGRHKSSPNQWGIARQQSKAHSGQVLPGTDHNLSRCVPWGLSWLPSSRLSKDVYTEESALLQWGETRNDWVESRLYISQSRAPSDSVWFFRADSTGIGTDLQKGDNCNWVFRHQALRNCCWLKHKKQIRNKPGEIGKISWFAPKFQPAWGKNIKWYGKFPSLPLITPN